MIPLSTTTAILVELLRGPGYGLDLIDRVHDRTEGRVRLRQGVVYPALRALARRKLVRSWGVATPGSGRPRRYYELTLAGIEAAREHRDTIARFTAVEERAIAPRGGVEAMRRGLFECAEASDAGAWLLRGGRRIRR